MPSSRHIFNKSPKSRITLRGDGEDGQHGFDGIDGNHGSVAPNHHGADGTDATPAQPGQNGLDIILNLVTLEHETSGKKMVKVHATSPQKGVMWDEVYALGDVPTIRWSTTGGDGGSGAVGGRGGHGAPAPNGIDAMPPDIPGSDGELGGNGGKGGAGSSGANAGNGGNVRVMIKEKDLYLLMALDPCGFDNSLLVGGEGGKKGRHGTGGKGGPGGKGGRPLTYLLEDTKKKKITIPGGVDGLPGADGLTPTWELTDGEDGVTGTFCIELMENGDEHTYAERFNILFENLELEGHSRMADPSECEFGDIISIRNIKVKNIGQMPLPPYQEIHFCIKDTGHHNVNPILSRKDAFLPTGTICRPGQYATSEGELKFFAGFPEAVEDEFDFDPLKQTARFHIQAFQYGPLQITGKERTSEFRREYADFHNANSSTINLSYAIGSKESMRAREDGVLLNLRYPIENRDGLKALRSLCPGEQTFISFHLDNVGAVPLGGYDVENADETPRRVAVRFFYLRSRKYDLPSDMITCSSHIDGGKESTEIDLVTAPKLLDVPTILPGDGYDFTTSLAFGKEIPLYSRMALIADIFIQTLPVPKGIKIEHENYDEDKRMPAMSLVQRRKLELCCEPMFEDREGSKVVLVTSYSTSQGQFDSWTKHVLSETLNMEYEIYSVSRYGSLDPGFSLENGKTLREVFRSKLIIVLTERFKENARDEEVISPIQLFPNGCMQQTSGYEPSTRFLVVGSNDSINKELLRAHLATEPTELGEFQDVASYQRSVSKFVEERATLGRENDCLSIRMDTINVSLPTSKDGKAAQKLKKVAESLADWLKTTDPLSQYTIEYFDHDFETQKKGLVKRKRTCLEVRRGFSRTLNTVVCVSGKYTAEPKQIKNDGMLMSIAEAMSSEMRVSFLAEALRNKMPDKVLLALKYACVSDMIRECNMFLEAEMKMNEDLELSFPSIGTLLDSVEMLSLLRDCKTFQDIRIKAIEELSDLLARLELVANSKDLRPRFSLVGASQKKTTKEAMSEIVERLRVQWKSVISNTRVDEIKKSLKEEIKGFLKEDTGKKVLNVRADGRWIQGLNYVHSTENDGAFGIANSSKRLIELDIDTQVDNYKIPHPSVRVLSSEEMKFTSDDIVYRKEQCGLIANSFRLKRQFRVGLPAAAEI